MSQASTRGFRSWLVPIGIIVIAGLLIALIVLQAKNGSDGGETAAGAAAAQAEQLDLTYLEARDENDVQAVGPVDAPVGLVVYSDYQCAFCAKWTNDILPKMMQYAQFGDLRIEWRDVNQYGEHSERAALAAHAAGLQGTYWEYHAALFPGGEHLLPEQLTEEALTGLAGDLGLDLKQFAADMHSEETLATVQQYAGEGRALGVSGTPTFVLGGEPIVGAQPESVFIDLLNHKMAEAR